MQKNRLYIMIIIGFFFLNYSGRVFAAKASTLSLDVKPQLQGDVDLDGAVLMNDAVVLFNYLYGGGKLTPLQLRTADADRSGYIDHSDPVTIFNYLYLGQKTPGINEIMEDLPDIDLSADAFSTIINSDIVVRKTQPGARSIDQKVTLTSVVLSPAEILRYELLPPVEGTTIPSGFRIYVRDTLGNKITILEQPLNQKPPTLDPTIPVTSQGSQMAQMNDQMFKVYQKALAELKEGLNVVDENRLRGANNLLKSRLSDALSGMGTYFTLFEENDYITYFPLQGELKFLRYEKFREDPLCQGIAEWLETLKSPQPPLLLGFGYQYENSLCKFSVVRNGKEIPIPKRFLPFITGKFVSGSSELMLPDTFTVNPAYPYTPSGIQRMGAEMARELTSAIATNEILLTEGEYLSLFSSESLNNKIYEFIRRGPNGLLEKEDRPKDIRTEPFPQSIGGGVATEVHYKLPKSTQVKVFRSIFDSYSVAGRSLDIFATPLSYLKAESYKPAQYIDKLDTGIFLGFIKGWNLSQGIVLFQSHGLPGLPPLSDAEAAQLPAAEVAKIQNERARIGAVVSVGSFSTPDTARVFRNKLFDLGFSRTWVGSTSLQRASGSTIFEVLDGVQDFSILKPQDFVFWVPCYGETHYQFIPSNEIIYHQGRTLVADGFAMADKFFDFMSGGAGTAYLPAASAFSKASTEIGATARFGWQGPKDGMDMILNPYILKSQSNIPFDTGLVLKFASAMVQTDFKNSGSAPPFRVIATNKKDAFVMYAKADQTLSQGTAECTAPVDSPKWLDPYTLQFLICESPQPVMDVKWYKIAAMSGPLVSADNNLHLNGRSIKDPKLEEHPDTDGKRDGERGYRPGGSDNESDWFYGWADSGMARGTGDSIENYVEDVPQ